MSLSSKTGLMESVRKPLPAHNKDPVSLTCSTKKAPFILRPFAGLYNPFSYGCSILCNHPADAEIRDVVKRAKDALILEGKTDQLPDELETIQAILHPSARRENCVDFVQEELFKRYTDTDSRPLTPAPTLASAVSRSSMKRRCLTPDHPPAPKQTLILDLRRSHSQETLFWHGFHTSDISSGLGLNSDDTNLTAGPSNNSSKKILKAPTNELPPLVSPVTLSKRSPNLKGNLFDRATKILPKNQLKVLQSVKASTNKIEKVTAPFASEDVDENLEDVLENGECEDEQIPILEGGDIRRRGRRKKGRNRLMSAALLTNTQNDPETQIAGIGSESHNPSSRESVIANEELDDKVIDASDNKTENKYHESFLQPDLLEYLHREVDQLAIETEFDPKRRTVLEEAYRTRSEKNIGKEMQLVLKEVQLPPVSLNKWLHLPRVFSRRNAMFSLPIDRRDFDALFPMQYVSEYVKVSSSKKLLYRIVLEKYNNSSMYLKLENIAEALKDMMGESLNDEKYMCFKSLLKWDDLTDDQLNSLVEKSILECEEIKPYDVNNEDSNNKFSSDDLFAEFDIVEEPIEEIVEDYKKIHFRTWCGVCGLCERLHAPLPPLQIDPPHEVEVADFDTLQGKLLTQKVDEKLSEILLAIQSSHLSI